MLREIFFRFNFTTMTYIENFIRSVLWYLVSSWRDGPNVMVSSLRGDIKYMTVTKNAYLLLIFALRKMFLKLFNNFMRYDLTRNLPRIELPIIRGKHRMIISTSRFNLLNILSDYMKYIINSKCYTIIVI